VQDHPIFSQFTGYQGPRPPATETHWIGAQFPTAWFGGPDYPACEVHIPVPALSEEYFEWIELLEAVNTARGRFVMLELGAGFGRWGICGALAARQKHIETIEVRFVEAEPQHAAWIRQAITLNGLEDIAAPVVEAAISYAGKPVPFAVASTGLDSSNWYGQAILPYALTETERTYFGKPVYRTEVGPGFDQIMVEPVTLDVVAAGLDRIDFVDMDLQGAEADLIPNAIDLLTARVRSVFIGTHATDIEDMLRGIFRTAGWIPRWDFPLQSEQETPFGRVAFGDGVQAWRNPTLS
jgi:FkbM family methyltransferase